MRIIPVLDFCVFVGRDRADFSHFRKKMSLGMRISESSHFVKLFSAV